MKLKFRAIITLLISFVAALPLYAATPTPGSSCKKAGLTATALGKKYTCVKAGSKLVWNKGAMVPVTPKLIPVMEPPAAPKFGTVDAPAAVNGEDGVLGETLLAAANAADGDDGRLLLALASTLTSTPFPAIAQG